MDSERPAAIPASPYGSKPRRWIKPVVLAAVLVAFDEQGVIAALLGALLIFVHLPRTFLAGRYAACRRERLQRFAIYFSAVMLVFGLRAMNSDIARGRAGEIISAVEAYKLRNGRYPERLDQLVPEFLAAIPARAKLTMTDRGYSYLSGGGSHSLSYVSFPPFGRRSYDFEGKVWHERLD